jgi:hypothetical protein
MNGIVRAWIAVAAMAAALPVSPSPAAAQGGTATIKGDNVELIYPRDAKEHEVRNLLEFLQADRRAILTQLGLVSARTIQARTYESVGRYQSESGQKQAWRGAVYAKGVLHIQPIQALVQRSIYETSLAYEMAMVLLDAAAAKGCPRWLRESYAVHHSGVLPKLTPAVGASLASFADLDQDIQEHASPPGREDVQYVLGMTMKFFIDRYGAEKAYRLYRDFDGKTTVDGVFKRVLGEPYATVEGAWAEHIRSLSAPARKQ